MNESQVPYLEVVERKASARQANDKVKEFWDREVKAADVKVVIDEKIRQLSEYSKAYLYGLLMGGGHVGMTREELRTDFMRNPAILEYWSQNQEEIDLYELFDQIDQECLAAGIVSEGYTTVWDVDSNTGETFDKNQRVHEDEPGRRFTLPVDYKTVEYLFTDKEIAEV